MRCCPSRWAVRIATRPLMSNVLREGIIRHLTQLQQPERRANCSSSARPHCIIRGVHRERAVKPRRPAAATRHSGRRRRRCVNAACVARWLGCEAAAMRGSLRGRRLCVAYSGGLDSTVLLIRAGGTASARAFCAARRARQSSACSHRRHDGRRRRAGARATARAVRDR